MSQARGLHLHSYSKDGIGTLNPTVGMGFGFLGHDPNMLPTASDRLPDDAYENLCAARRFPFHRRAAGGETVAKGEGHGRMAGRRLPETNIGRKNRPSRRKLVFQPSILGCVSF